MLSRLSRSRITASTLLALLLPPLFVVAAKLAYDRWDHVRGVRAVFGGDQARRLAVRFSCPAADRHRPLSAGLQPPVVHHTDLARLERAGNRPALVAATAQIGDLAGALRLLEGSAGPDAESDRAAVLSLDPRRQVEALAAADRALHAEPDHARARWNRGLLLESLGLPLAAASAFRAVQRRGEPGWRDEARQRAQRLEGEWQARFQAFGNAQQEAERIKRGQLPSAATIASHPDSARLAFFTALRDSTSDLTAIAPALDRASDTASLAALLPRKDVLVRMLALLRAGTVASARQYQALADDTGDPWLRIRARQLVCRNLTGAGEPRAAVTACEEALALCPRFPWVCTGTKLWLANLHGSQRRIQEARRWALEARRDSVASALPEWEAEAQAQLGGIELLRERFPLARAYAEEAAASRACGPASTGHELLAKIALSEDDPVEARRHLSLVRDCPGAVSRFGPVGTEALADLARRPGFDWPQGRELLAATLARSHSQALSPLLRRTLRLYEAKMTLARDRARARAELAALVAEGGADSDEVTEMVRLEASSALVVDAAGHGELSEALALLERDKQVPAGRLCLLGAAADAGRFAFVARARDGQLAGEAVATSAVPQAVVAALAGCPEVGVAATAPVLGRSRLLPAELAWSYLGAEPAPPRPAGTVRRLVISDVAPPEALGLPQLGPVAVPVPGPGEQVDQLRGLQATPPAALAQAAGADLIEWHVHGIVDPDVSDAAALVLSADEGGHPLLTARDIQGSRLPRRPGVVLGACQAGLSARYGAYQWSLPLAFLRAGARWVIASPSPIEDAEAPPFFAAVWRRIVAGATPAVALRDERLAPRWRHSYQQWTQDVVLFD